MTLPDENGYTPKYQAHWSRATPGLVVFLIDQSASMSQYGAGEIPIADRVANLVNSAIFELCRTSTLVNWDVANTMFIMCIGYGYDGHAPSYYILSEWLSRFEELYEPDKMSIIQPRAYGLPNMTEAFAMVVNIIQEWTQFRLESNSRFHNPVPVIFHLTKGTNIGDEKELLNSVQQIKCIEMPDGHPLLFNLLFPTHGFFDTLEFPSEEQLISCKLSEKYEMIIKTASAFPQEMMDEYHKYGYSNINKNSLCLMINPTRIPVEHIANRILIL